MLQLLELHNINTVRLPDSGQIIGQRGQRCHKSRAHGSDAREHISPHIQLTRVVHYRGTIFRDLNRPALEFGNLDLRLEQATWGLMVCMDLKVCLKSRILLWSTFIPSRSCIPKFLHTRTSWCCLAILSTQAPSMCRSFPVFDCTQGAACI